MVPFIRRLNLTGAVANGGWGSRDASEKELDVLHSPSLLQPCCSVRQGCKPSMSKYVRKKVLAIMILASYCVLPSPILAERPSKVPQRSHMKEQT